MKNNGVKIPCFAHSLYGAYRWLCRRFYLALFRLSGSIIPPVSTIASVIKFWNPHSTQITETLLQVYHGLSGTMMFSGGHRTNMSFSVLQMGFDGDVVPVR